MYKNLSLVGLLCYPAIYPYVNTHKMFRIAVMVSFSFVWQIFDFLELQSHLKNKRKTTQPSTQLPHSLSVLWINFWLALLVETVRNLSNGRPASRKAMKVCYHFRVESSAHKYKTLVNSKRKLIKIKQTTENCWHVC